MPNRIVALALCLLLPIPVYASDMNVLNGLFTVIYVLYVVLPATLIHLIATFYFYKKYYYTSKSFTIKHLAIAMFFPVVGIAIVAFECLSSKSPDFNDFKYFVLGVLMYSAVSLVFAIPYLLYRSTKRK